MPSNSWSIGTRSPSGSTTATEAAKGRSVRTVRPPSFMWAPRTECGSWNEPVATRSSTCRSTGLRAGPDGPTGVVDDGAAGRVADGADGAAGVVDDGAAGPADEDV